MEQATLQRARQAQNLVVNDLTRRVGYSGGVPMMTMSPEASGLDCNPVTGGKALYLLPRQNRHRGMWDDLRQAYSVRVTTTTPGQFLKAIKRKFTENDDLGFRELASLTNVAYDYNSAQPYDDAEVYFDVVHPPIVCPEGLEADWVWSNEGNVGARHYQACPTCRLAELRSQECSDRILGASQMLDSAILSQLRQELIESCEAAIRYADRRVREVDADLEKRSRGEHGRTVRNEADHIFLKMLHRKAPNAQPALTPEQLVALTAAGVGQAVAGAMQSNQQNAQTNDAEYAEFLEFKKMKADIEAEEARKAEINAKRAESLKKAREAKNAKSETESLNSEE